MPIYEYACQSCGHELEALQSISDEPLTECPQCGEPQLRKLISAAAFRLKGGGWYETDFKKDKRRNLAGDGEKSSSSSESKSDGGSGSGKSSSGDTASKKSAQG
jgi:putative FmdB family regulatory protein